MLKTEFMTVGKLGVRLYDFENKGDVLEEHIHTKEDAHISIVTAGVLRLFGDIEKKLLAGDLIKIEPGQKHGFEALTPRSRLINIPYGDNT